MCRLLVLAFVFSAPTFNKVERASGPVLVWASQFGILNKLLDTSWMDLPVWYPERVDQAPLDLGISAANIPSTSVDLERVSFGGLVTSRRSEEGLFIGPAVMLCWF